MRCLVRVPFYRVPTMRKRKRKFTGELKRNYACFRNGRDEWEAKCLVCKPGTSVSGEQGCS